MRYRWDIDEIIKTVLLWLKLAKINKFQAENFLGENTITIFFISKGDSFRKENSRSKEMRKNIENTKKTPTIWLNLILMIKIPEEKTWKIHKSRKDKLKLFGTHFFEEIFWIHFLLFLVFSSKTRGHFQR